MAVAGLDLSKRERWSLSEFTAPVLIALATGALTAMAAGVGDGTRLSPDWKLGLMFGVGALLAACAQTFLHQAFELRRMKQSLLSDLRRDQEDGEALLDSLREAQDNQPPARN